MKNKRVLFTGKNNRTLRLDTINNPPNGVEFIKQEREDTPDHLANKKSVGRSLVQKGLDFTRYNNRIPKKDLKNVDIIYSTGKIIFNNFNWVVEIDNVSCLTYYNLELLELFKNLLLKKLKSKWCKKIICISESAKKSVNNFFKDKEIENKCEVVYPYTHLHKKTKRKDNIIRLLYVSREFYLKGGKQIINVFEKINKKFPTTHLTIVSEWYNEKRIKNVTVVNPTMNKNKLFRKYYTKNDIFVIPSYQDSFGSVVQEAISSGMVVVCTDMFAFTEMVKDGYNGFIIKSPIKYFVNYLPNKKYWNRDLNSYVKDMNFEGVEKELEEKLTKLIRDKYLMKRMGKNSKKLAKQIFEETKRKAQLKRILK